MPDIFVDKDTNEPAKKPTPRSGNSQHVTPPPKPKHKSEISTFETFKEYPKGVSFQHQENDEEIILFLRQHFITNIPWLVITVLLSIAPFVLLPFFEFLMFFPLTLPGRFVFMFLLFYYLCVFAYAFVNFLHWFYNIGIVTNKHIVDIDYTDIVHVHVAATKVLQIQDVTYAQAGFLRTLFHYGDVVIQTAGHSLNFEFLRIPNPSRATFLIQKLIGLA